MAPEKVYDPKRLVIDHLIKDASKEIDEDAIRDANEDV